MIPSIDSKLSARPLLGEIAKIIAVGILSATTLALSACGGGGGGGSTASAPAPVSAPSPAPAPTGSTPVVGDANVLALYVDSGVSGSNVPNGVYASVKVCSPGSASNCAVIDHVLVDTGSTGLRVIASALPAGILSSLPISASGANKIGECLAFASGATWGGVRTADLWVGGTAYNGRSALNLPVQIIADSNAAFSAIPASCASQGSLMQTASALGANGILGVGLFAQDCGSACANSAANVYYACPSTGGCSATAYPLANQVANPISLFQTDNNGNSIVMPAVPGGASTRLDGLMVFGIGTSSNNALASGSSVLAVDSQGYFSASFNGNTLSNSFIDSGSSINFFPASGTQSFPVCSGMTSFFCPASPSTISASLSGLAGTASTASVYTVNASSAFNASPSSWAFSGLSGPAALSQGSLDLGASFFFGRSVATHLENTMASGFSTSGPGFAHTP